MLQLGKFAAWVNLEGAELPQYGVSYSPDGLSASCWIPSEADKNFSVCWKDEAFSFPSLGRVSADGITCGGLMMEREEHAVLAEKDSVETSKTTQRLLAFSPIEVTDNDLDAITSPNLGEIKLEVLEVEIYGEKEATYAASDGLAKADKLHERSKKAASHRVKLGKEITLKNRPVCTVNILCIAATFYFHYRPIEILKANGIIPVVKAGKRPASEPAEIIDLEEDEEADRVKEARIKELEKELQALREERSRSWKRVKREIKTEAKVEQLDC